MPPLQIAVACHDAGGAEVVSSYIRQQGLEPYVMYANVHGPAKEIFQEKLPSVPQRNFFKFDDLDQVICGTGTTGFESAFTAVARRKGVFTVAYLDHWKNYRLRFPHGLPDEIWTTDEYSFCQARQDFPVVDTVLKDNPYLTELMHAVASIKYEPSEKTRILVVYDKGEDVISLHAWRLGTYTVRNRPHPADKRSERPLAEDLAWADVVVGWDSMALVAAKSCGIKTYSVLPREQRAIPYDIPQLP